MTPVEEPVLESAPLARQVAPRLCRMDPVSAENCAWYHGFWQYLRALRLITTPEHHAEFFRRAFGAVAEISPEPRILISGAADYSTFAHVLWACRQHGLKPQITVADLCETPLFLTRWYAERIAVGVETHAGNMLDYKGSETFDAVCTHSFFGRFTGPERERLMSSWNRLLRPGGVAIAVNRVRAGGGEERMGFTPEQARAFRAAVVSKAESVRAELDLDPQELGRMAEAYAVRHRVYPVRSQDEIRRLFEDARLEVESLDVRPVAKAEGAPLGGPTTLEGAGYVCVVARKTG